MGPLSEGIHVKVVSSRVLVVGAGGIGCELLKNLVLTGFRDIEVIDLDTIDVSNLNRQFLFQKQHVGQSKAAIAVQTVLKYCPDANVKHHHNNIMSPEFDVNYYKRFTIVLNALDNRAARIHVNRLCLAANVALVESGSSGYLGQVSVILKGISECYECLPKAVQRTYPGCTIRNTPSEPIHCIVWAKHLFNQLFGEADIDEDVSPDTTDPQVQEGNENGLTGQRISTRKWAVDNEYQPELLFSKLFNDDIHSLLSMGNLWKKRKPPIVLNWTKLPDEHPGCSSAIGSSTAIENRTIRDRVIWTPLKCRVMFSEAVEQLKRHLDAKEDGRVLVWDKDDEFSVQFVTSCANLRSYVFGIQLKSLFDVKSMAGNIVPAIATTNAIVAGMIVMETLKIIMDNKEQCRSVFISRKPNPRGKILVDQILDKPNPKCYVCSNKSEVFVQLNTKTFTIKSLEDKVLKQSLNMMAPDVEVADGSGTIVISSEPEETAELDNKALSELNLIDGSQLQCDDFMQQLQFRLIIVHNENLGHDSEFTVEAERQLHQKTFEETPKMEENSMMANKLKRTFEEDREIDRKKPRTEDADAVLS